MTLMTGRASPSFTAIGYGLIIVAGVIMIVQSLRPGTGVRDDHGHSIVAGMGLLPCPLTISVLGFAWTQTTAMMVGLVLISLALGISLTIGAVAVFVIGARRGLGAAFAQRLSDMERGARIAQGAAGALIVAIGIYTLARLAV